MIRVNKIEKSDARIAAFKRYKVLCISTVKSLLDVEYIKSLVSSVCFKIV